MRGWRLGAGLAVAVAVAAGLGLAVLRGGADPGDRALDPPLPEGPLRIAVLGTSLSAPPQTWPDALGAALAACRGAPVEMARVAGPGRGSDWGEEQADRVAATEPDVVLVEFAINDADILDGAGLATTRDRHLALLAALAAAAPDARPVLMTMSPARGPRGWVRPRLAAHYAQYGALARQAGTGLVDIHARWRALPTHARGLDADGLHPDPAVAASVIVPAIRAVLAPDCAAD